MLDHKSYLLNLIQKETLLDKHILTLTLDLEGKISDASTAYLKFLDLQKNDLIGESIAVAKDNFDKLLENQTLNKEINIKKSSGAEYSANITISPLFNDQRKKTAYYCLYNDISEINRVKLTPLLTHDNLLRDIFHLEDEAMLIVLHIDQMQSIKNLYGFDFANTLLIKKAVELKGILNEKEARLYNLNLREFAILVTQRQFFEKYKSLLEYSILVNDEYNINTLNEPINVDLTAGIAFGTTHLLNHADVVLQEALLTKKKYKIYYPRLNPLALEEDKIKKLYTYKEALSSSNIIPYFQVIVDTVTSEIVKYEALARIKTTEGRIVSPLDFLDASKDDKSFEYFTRQMMQKTFNIYAKNNIHISFNLSYENILSPSMVAYIENRLQKYGGEGITFEILESEDIEDYDKFNLFIDMVKSYGCKVAIDDFGSGYSNFCHILQLNIDYIKLDGSIVQQLNNNENIKNMVNGLVTYAKSANIKTIAEYISCEALYDSAKKLGIDYCQGYYFSEPKSAQELGFNI